MIETKSDFIKAFLPENIQDIKFMQIDLDETDLSLADVLRNINKLFPNNSRNRNAIITGELAIAILLKSEKLDPLGGLFLIITNDAFQIEIVSCNYIVLTISEKRIKNNKEILYVLEGVTDYLIKNFKDAFKDFNEFYVKYIYDIYELESET